MKQLAPTIRSAISITFVYLMMGTVAQSDSARPSPSRERADGPTERAGTDWWSLQPVVRPSIPLGRSDWVRNPIDAFVLQKLESLGLKTAPETDRLTFARRATFGLLGLPPAPEELKEFLADEAPHATERLIDRLLASPHYGERWARHWLDVVRFGESDGFENDKLREHAWRYRDYVIESLNADLPYSQFVRDQLAGDVGAASRQSIAATGFLVAGPWDEIQFVAKSKIERLRAREEQLEELLGTIGQTFLGLTVHCARCHDHKFDPIPQLDYYRWKAVFDGVDHRTGDPQIDNMDRGNRSIFTAAEAVEHAARVAPIQSRITALKASLRDIAGRLGSDALAVSDQRELLVGNGRFGGALTARNGHAEAVSKAEFHRPPITIECWAQVNSKAGFNILVANNLKESSEHWEVYSFAGSGEFSVFLPGYAPAEIKSGVDITDGRWHYLAVTLDGERVRMYADGKFVHETPVKRLKHDGPVGRLWIGAYPPQKIGCDGLVDEVRISRIVRSIERVPDSPFESDEHTIGLWCMDRLESDRFVDSSRQADAESRVATLREEESVRRELRAAETELARESVPLAYCGIRRHPEPTQLFMRGDILKPGPVVEPGGLSSLRGIPSDFKLSSDAAENLRRQRFADWITSSNNPLTSRVMVNRIWHYHFGRGLVDTPSDFGLQGGRPSHPELLDWLASEFVESGWSVKHVQRLILTSATYRQANAWHASAAQRDPDNRFLWHFSPRRLEGEAIRDAMLAVSGELNRRIGGASFQPFTTTTRNTVFYHLFDSGEPEYNRRTIYRMHINTGKDPLLDSLDCPAPSLTMPQRRSTNTTLQALSLMNDTFVLRQADRFANRLQQAAGGDRSSQLRLAFETAFARQPTPDELAATMQLVVDHGLASACWAILNSSEFLYLR